MPNVGASVKRTTQENNAGVQRRRKVGDQQDQLMSNVRTSTKRETQENNAGE